ncbi:hypothetical protein FRC12_009606 [Ceratobasidium sp. 428]|nr:hypothetical protein FRC12_009606 [Ceratobasidium sp. 428]
MYREFTSGKRQPPAESDVDLESSEGDEDFEADTGYTVIEVVDAVLRAQTAEEVTQPFDDGGCEYELEDKFVVYSRVDTSYLKRPRFE